MSIEKGILTSCTPAECYVWNRWQLALIITQVATNEFCVLKNLFQRVSSPQRGDMSIEDGVFKSCTP